MAAEKQEKRSKHIERAWLEFERKVVPGNAGATQRIEMRRAFYAGASAFFHITLANVSDEPGFTAHDEALMEGLSAELEAFSVDVMAGRA